MRKNTLRILSYLTVSYLYSAIVIADDQIENSQESVSVQPKRRTFCQTYDMLKTSEITPPVGAVLSDGVEGYVKASYILWHASEDGLDYGIYGIADPTAPVKSTRRNPSVQPQGRVAVPDFRTSSGFKFGWGFDFAYDNWDFGLTYTWLHTHARSFVSAVAKDPMRNIVGVLLPTHLDAFPTQTADAVYNSVLSSNASGFAVSKLNNVNSSWRLQFNVVELDLGRTFFISSKLLLRPHYGLKGTWQKQNNIIRYVALGEAISVNQGGIAFIENVGPRFVFVNTPTTQVSIEDAVETYKLSKHQASWGLGPRAGLDFSWLITKHFSLFTEGSLSLLWGQFTSKREDISFAADATTGAIIFANYNPVDVRFRSHGVNSVIEMQMGLRYDHWFAGGEYRLRSEVGWENQLWFNQNNFVNTTENNKGDLSLEGFTFTFEVNF